MPSRPSSPLRQMRLTRTMKQDDLARMVEITQESLSKAERGLIQLRPEIQARLAAVLGVSPADLFPRVSA